MTFCAAITIPLYRATDSPTLCVTQYKPSRKAAHTVAQSRASPLRDAGGTGTINRSLSFTTTTTSDAKIFSLVGNATALARKSSLINEVICLKKKTILCRKLNRSPRKISVEWRSCDTLPPRMSAITRCPEEIAILSSWHFFRVYIMCHIPSAARATRQNTHHQHAVVTHHRARLFTVCEAKMRVLSS